MSASALESVNDVRTSGVELSTSSLATGRFGDPVLTLRLIPTVATAAVMAAALPGGVAQAAAPAPVTNLAASVVESVIVTMSWTDSFDTDLAQVCYRVGPTAPASPADADATCHQPQTSDFGDFDGTEDTTYAISVFAVDATTHEPSPPTSTTVTTTHRPPLDAYGVYTTAVDEHRLRLHWTGDTRDGDIPAEATVAWVITVVPGTSPAALDAPPTAQVPGSIFGSYLATELAAGQPYTFTVRGKNASGDLSKPVSWTAGTRVLGVRVWDAAASGASMLPATRGRNTTASADTTAGVTRVAFTNAASTRIYYARRGMTSGWSKPVLVGSGGISLSTPKLGGR